MNNVHTNSAVTSKIMPICGMSEPNEFSNDGIYIGKTMIYKLPFFLDKKAEINPHITIIGMTGSGKSYLLKSIVARSVMLNGCNVAVIDWNNEYSKLISFIGGRVLSIGSDFKINLLDMYCAENRSLKSALDLLNRMLNFEQSQRSLLHIILKEQLKSKKSITLQSLICAAAKVPKGGHELESKLSELMGSPIFCDETDFDIKRILSGRFSINLSSLKDDIERSEVSAFVVGIITKAMHEMELGSQSDTIVVLDEAWRLIENTNEIGVLFREARKYNISIIAATQMASDINNEIIANSGCIFLFRLQSEQDYLTLNSIGILDNESKDMLARLGIGSCMVHLALKDSSSIRKFFIGKVDGVDFENVKLLCGSMRLEISYKRFEECTKEYIGDANCLSKILSYIAENSRNVDLRAFIIFMQSIGLKRPEIIAYLRSMELRDLAIVDAYEK